ncbi:MAG TPA: nucleotide sugar dehydrogenase [Candidatus Udaeobacter sp.]|jgi:GDP-mannose 6-dehydrogenase|nr:nucleotide sugar dehydrogenase [Candidatus Udaeobacter sp.]
MRVVVVGLGYVGSVCSACLSSRGHTVVGVDTSTYKVDLIERGESPIVETGLAELIREAREAKRLCATTKIDDALKGAEVVLICVGTPSAEDGSLNLEHVKRACAEVGAALPRSGVFTTVVMRSTMLPGSVEGELSPVLERSSGLVAGRDFGLAYNPEFLREGTAVADFFGAELTVIGAADEKSAAGLRTLYQGLGGALEVVPIRAAEMLKYVNNAYHALKVSFANEVGRVCQKEGVDSHEVMRLFCVDRRLNLGPTYLKPGFAFGGSCLPKDLRALGARARHHSLDLPVVGSILRSNDLHIEAAIHMIERLGRRRIGVLGLSFKEGTDDLRESPILRVIGTLVGKGYSVLLHDPNIDMERVLGANRAFVEHEVPYLPERLRADLDEVVRGSDIVVVANGAREYRDVGAKLEDGQCLVDLVHAVDPASVAHGEYHGLAW